MHVRNLAFDSPQPPPEALSGPERRHGGVWSVVLRPASKRAMDIALSAAMLLVLLPVFLAISAIVAADGGPAFYSHKRVGRGGRTFGCLKFRSMRTDADRLLAELLARDPSARAEWEATRKLRRDPRVTPIGRLLRATSLDELPQLLNVLRGDMSLVGPRPVVQEELDQHYAPAAATADYLSVRPGVTGPWQVSGRSDVDYRQRVALDSQYARNPSLRKDIMLLALTVIVVLRCRGAY
ncbi:sugar transferase [Craurococcus roseus]|uniref:Sugar transferase n=1 Tax=Craurococcus roseus TaxID=77585 RepID=A0ABN1F7Z3_9PROT